MSKHPTFVHHSSRTLSFGGCANTTFYHPFPFKKLFIIRSLFACSHHELSIFRWPRRRESRRRLHRSQGARCNARRCSPAKQLTLRRRSTV
jgi:hypothetical protein